MLSGTLKGTLTIDLSQGVAGPYAALLLAQYGSSVIKIEPPQGDWGRRLGATGDNPGPYFLATNFGKRGLVLDLKNAVARDAALALCAKADIVIEAFRPGVMQRLGLGYDSLKAINSRIIYVSINGFGSSVELRDRPATDSVVQAMSGMMHENHGTEDGIPHRVPGTPLDLATGMFAFQAAIMSLLARDRGHNSSYYVECSILRTAAALNNVGLIGAATSAMKNERPASPLGVFRTVDGWISIAIIGDDQWRRFCSAVGRNDWGNDERFDTLAKRIKHDSFLSSEVKVIFASGTTATWARKLAEADILAEVIQNFEEFLKSAQLKAANILSFVTDPIFGNLPVCLGPGLETAPDRYNSAPSIGQHTKEVLLQFGLMPATIDTLVGGKG
jgi:crotonobetainyl-CoA:carnitine CoA-transferase CaiB-like acyl-CoA transferase